MDFSKQSTRSALSASQVLDIRRLRSTGCTDHKLATKYGVSRKTIYDIERRNTWRDIPAPTTVRGFKGYEVYPDGRVLSTATGKFIKQTARGTVKLTTSGGLRKTVAVSTLVQKGFK